MLLELRGLTKRFGSLVANDSIDLEVRPGEVHALLGENGAGKSTLMNMLYGLLTPDEGQILVDGTPLTFAGPGDAIAAGIGMVHQHFMLVPVFTVAENVALGREKISGLGVLDRESARRRVRELSEAYGLAVDPDALVADLPVGVQQRVEILKALANEAQVLILDEPTAVLTPREIDDLIAILRQLKAAGTAVVFITHKLKEVKALADRITVIRRGKVVGEARPDASEAEMAELMVGRRVVLRVDKDAAAPADVALDVRDLTVVSTTGQPVVDGVSFQVRRGEIVGIAGVQGNGQTELAQALLGLVTPSAGSIGLRGTELAGRTPRECLRAGVGFVPEDRKHDGLVGSFSVAENLVLDLYRRSPFGRGLRMDPRAVRDNADRRIREFDVRVPDASTPVSALSGGNQQKVVLAREMSRPLELLVASQPTRGLDVGSIEFVHRRIVAERDNGTAVVIVSSELDEVVALADRILVMYRGRIVGEVGPDAPHDQIGLMMAGVPTDAAGAEASAHPSALAEVE